MFKRILSCVACVLLLASVCCQAVSARAATTTFSLSVNDGKVGETVTVSLSLSAESYFTNCTFYVHYDPNVVSFITDSELTGPISPSTSMLYVMDHTDQKFVKGAYVTVKGIKKEGVLLSLDFTVLKEAATQFSLSFDECVGVDENDTEFDVSYQVVPCTLNAHAAPATPATTAPTAAPATPTAAPANPTATPANPTAAPANPTAAPANPTAAPTTPTTTPAMPQGTTSAGQSTPVAVGATTMTAGIGQNVTLPTTIPTDAQGNTLATVPTTVVTNADGVTVTQPAGDMPAEEQVPGEIVPTKDKNVSVEDPVENKAMSVLGIVLIIVACVLIAGGVAVAALLVRKKRAAEVTTDVPTEGAPTEETPVVEETPAEVSSADAP